MGSAGRKSRSKSFSESGPTGGVRKPQYLVCIANGGYAASLELRKIYRKLPDARAAAHRLFRVIDESGQGYLYPSGFFVPIVVPRKAAAAFGNSHRMSA